MIDPAPTAPSPLPLSAVADTGRLPALGRVQGLLRTLDWGPLGPYESWPQSLRTAVDICLASPQPMLIAWGDALRVIFNDAYLSLHGERGLGQPLLEHLPDQVEDFRAVWKSGQSREQKGIALVPLHDERGVTAGVLALSNDADALAGVIGHDLRNPLAAILTAAQLLERRAGTDERIMEPARRIVSSSERMSRMLDQLLEYTHLQAHGLTLQRTELDLAIVTRDAIDSVRARDLEGKVTFDTVGDVNGELDPERIAQVVSNLVGNAACHAPSAACRVRTDGTSPTLLALTVENDGELPANLKLFEPFKMQGRTRGLGLGLYFVKAIVEAHGGAVNAQSTGGVTRFTVLLPRQPRPMNAR